MKKLIEAIKRMEILWLNDHITSLSNRKKVVAKGLSMKMFG